MAIKSSAAYRGKPAFRSRRALESVLHRLTERDYAILHALYIGRALSTRQIQCAFWTGDWYARDGRTVRYCQRRLQALREWGLIRYEDVPSLKEPLSGAWGEEPVARPLDDWGTAITITGHGIRALVKADFVPETRVSETGQVVRGFETASSLRPSATRYRHVLMTSAAVLRAIAAARDEYTWTDARHLARAVTDRRSVIPDALIQTRRLAWAIECDRASIWVDELLDRWRTQAPEWNEVYATDLLLPGAARLGGVLWYIADSSPHRLLNRVRRLREVAARELDLPRGMGWYVDSFDGLAWTWDHWLGPWTRGKKWSPQAILEKVVEVRVGKDANIVPLACLGNIDMWHRAHTWAADAYLARRDPPWCLALVRDFVEAEQVWSIGQEKGQADHMLFVIPDPKRPKACLGLKQLWYRPAADQGWRELGLRDLLAMHSCTA